jgi:hypothetical protein
MTCCGAWMQIWHLRADHSNRYLTWRKSTRADGALIDRDVH